MSDSSDEIDNLFSESDDRSYEDLRFFKDFNRPDDKGRRRKRKMKKPDLKGKNALIEMKANLDDRIEKLKTYIKLGYINQLPNYLVDIEYLNNLSIMIIQKMEEVDRTYNKESQYSRSIINDLLKLLSEYEIFIIKLENLYKIHDLRGISLPLIPPLQEVPRAAGGDIVPVQNVSDSESFDILALSDANLVNYMSGGRKSKIKKRKSKKKSIKNKKYKSKKYKSKKYKKNIKVKNIKVN